MAVDVPKLAAVLAGSLTVLLQTLVQEKAGWDFFWFWALLISSLSTAACAPTLLVAVCRRASPDTPARSAPTLCLAVLWTAGTLPLTMEKPFELTGNGFFGCWASLVNAWLMALAAYPAMTEPLDSLVGGNGARVAMLLIASMAALLQTAWSCWSVSGWCNGNAAWVLVCSSVSATLCGSLLTPQVSDKLQQHFKLIALFFLVWWCAGAVVTTFEKPYEQTFANGYFSCWGAVLISAFLVESSWGFSVSSAAASKASEVAGGVPPEILLLAGASLVTLVASAMDCAEGECWHFDRWAVACSALSFAVCFAMIIYTLRGGWITGGTLLAALGSGLLGWWILGTGCMTFVGPFLHLGNGYFAAWVALVAACRFAVRSVEFFRQRIADLGKGGREVGVILLASEVLAVQAGGDCIFRVVDGGHIFGLVCGAVSGLLCLGLGVSWAKLEENFRLIAAFFFAWWSCGVLVLTFHWPYVRTGNGYFACWCACIASGRLAVQQFPQIASYADLGGALTAQDSTGASPSRDMETAPSPQTTEDGEALPTVNMEPGASPTVMGQPFTGSGS